MAKLSTIEIAWAAGFLEGEGTFIHNGSVIGIHCSQVQREPLERLQKMFGGKILALNPKGVGGLRRPINIWYIYGKRAAEITMTMLALLSPRRLAQAIAALNVWKAQPKWQRGNSRCAKGHAYVMRKRSNGKEGRYCPSCQNEASKRYREKGE